MPCGTRINCRECPLWTPDLPDFMELPLTFFILLILFLAALVHSTLGFGTGLVAMPLLTLLVDVKTATPLVAFVIVTNTLIIMWGTWQSADWRSAWRLILASLAGIPVGLAALRSAPEGWIKSVLGILIILFSLYHLLRPQFSRLDQSQWAYFFGFLGGILGGAYNTNAPPIVIYGAMRRWSPARFRATLQGYFLPTSILIWLGHGAGGLWTGQVVYLYGLSLPLLFLAVLLGYRLNRYIPTVGFERLLYVTLIGLGILLVV